MGADTVTVGDGSVITLANQGFGEVTSSSSDFVTASCDGLFVRTPGCLPQARAVRLPQAVLAWPGGMRAACRSGAVRGWPCCEYMFATLSTCGTAADRLRWRYQREGALRTAHAAQPRRAPCSQAVRLADGADACTGRARRAWASRT